MRQQIASASRTLLVALIVALVLPGTSRAQEVLTNESVVQLTQAGVDPAVIVSTIESSRTRFELAVQQIVELSGKKVDKDVIAAMQSSLARGGQAAAGKGASAAVPTAPLPTTYGAFALQSDRFDALPMAKIVVKELKDRDGRVTKRWRGIDEPAVARKVPVHAADPSFVVFLQSAGNASTLKLIPLEWSTTTLLSADIADDVVDIPVRVGPLGNDPRYVKVTPGRDLPIGVYALLSPENPGAAHLVYRVQGQIEPPSLGHDPVATLAATRSAVELALDLPAEDARALVQQVLSREKIGLESDFDGDGLLITRPEIRMGGFLGRNTNREQYAVLVESAGTGSKVRVLADVWKAGTPDGAVNASNARVTHLLSDKDGNAKRADSMSGEIRKAAQRAARRR